MYSEVANIVNKYFFILIVFQWPKVFFYLFLLSSQLLNPADKIMNIVVWSYGLIMKQIANKSVVCHKYNAVITCPSKLHEVDW